MSRNCNGRCKPFLFLTIGVLLVSIAGANPFYISPSGNDGNPGTEVSPWKTIQKARDHIRAINGSMSADITVYLSEGTYPPSNTLEFGPQDSGSNGYNIIYRNVPGEAAIISGGVGVTGWTQHSGNIYKAPLYRTTKLRQLYVNGARAFMAQTSVPVVGKGSWGTFTITGSEPWAEVAGTTPDGVLFNLADLGDYNHPGDIELHQKNEAWREYIVCVREIAESNGKRLAKLQQPMGAFAYAIWNAQFSATGQFDIVNAYELLDSPGEFYFDKSAQIVYYCKFNTDDMATASVVVPTVEKLIEIKGNSKTDRVRNIQFKGLVFAHNHYPLEEVAGSRGWVAIQSVSTYRYFTLRGATPTKTFPGAFDIYDIQSAAIEIYNSESIVFERNIFQHIGNVGVSLPNDVIDSDIRENYFMDIGSAAVNVGHVQHRRLDNGPLFPPGVENACDGVLVKNNIIRDPGVEILMAPTISAFFVRNTEISHNDIDTCPYDAISLGWEWFYDETSEFYTLYGERSNTMYNNKINYNKIDNYNHHFKDGGAIYTLGVQNADYNLTADPSDTSHWSELRGNFLLSGQGAGYYADEGTRFWKMYDNAINGGGWLWANPGTRDLFVDGLYTGIGFPWGAETDLSKNIIINNIDHSVWNYSTYATPAGLYPIASNAGIEPSLRTEIPDPTDLAIGKPVTLYPGLQNDYWQVDLGAVYDIDTVLLWSGGSSADKANIKDFHVFVSQTPFTSNDPAVVASDPDVWNGFYPGVLQPGVNRSDFVRVRRPGRYVRIQLTGNDALVLSRVEIFENLMNKSMALIPICTLGAVDLANHDCRITMDDLLALTENWLQCAWDIPQRCDD